MLLWTSILTRGKSNIVIPQPQTLLPTEKVPYTFYKKHDWATFFFLVNHDLNYLLFVNPD